MPMPRLRRVLLSASAREAPSLVVNNGGSTATRNTKISSREQRIRRVQKRSGEQTTPASNYLLHFVSRSLSVRLCLFRCSLCIASTRRRATRRSKFIRCSSLLWQCFFKFSLLYLTAPSAYNSLAALAKGRVAHQNSHFNPIALD